MFLILAALMMVMAANDWMLTWWVLAFAMVVGTLLGWVGDHIPEDLVRRRHALRLPCGRCLQYLQSHR